MFCGQIPSDVCLAHAAHTVLLHTVEPQGTLSQHGLAVAPEPLSWWLWGWPSDMILPFHGSAKQGKSRAAAKLGCARRQRLALCAGDKKKPLPPLGSGVRDHPALLTQGSSSAAVAPRRLLGARHRLGSAFSLSCAPSAVKEAFRPSGTEQLYSTTGSCLGAAAALLGDSLVVQVHASSSASCNSPFVAIASHRSPLRAEAGPPLACDLPTSLERAAD